MTEKAQEDKKIVKLLIRKEVKEILRLSDFQLDGLVSDGTLTPIIIGKKMKFSEDQVLALIAPINQ